MTSQPGLKTVQTPDGLFWLNNDPDDVLGHSDHEWWLNPIIFGLMPEGGTFLDVGAHVGHYALRMVAEKRAHVYAVEANPDTAATLGANAAMNGMLNDVDILEYAASDAPGWVGLVDPNGHRAGGSTRVEGSGNVQAVQLDDVLPHRGIALVKMDIEGHEAHALFGMREILRTSRPTIVLEMHQALYPDQNIEQVCRVFLEKTLGYTIEVLREHFHAETGAKVCEYWLCIP